MLRISYRRGVWYATQFAPPGLPTGCGPIGKKPRRRLPAGELPPAANTGLLAQLADLTAIWSGDSKHVEPLWPQAGIAIEGDFAGIQKFVLRPVPGARGAAKRLRARSFRVVALAQLLADHTTASFPGGSVFYTAGGRFLVTVASTNDVCRQVEDLQRELDHWVHQEFDGEVVFRLAAQPLVGGRIPVQLLRDAMLARGARPLQAALRSNGQWRTDACFRKPAGNARRCKACLRTVDRLVRQEDDPGEEVCQQCDDDKKLGGKLAKSPEAGLAEAPQGEIRFAGRTYTFTPNSPQPVGAVRWAPKDRNGDAIPRAESYSRQPRSTLTRGSSPGGNAVPVRLLARRTALGRPREMFPNACIPGIRQKEHSRVGGI